MVDLILFCDLEVTPGPDGKPTVRRVMRTKPSPNYEAGDRTGRLPEVIDLDFRVFLEAFNKPTAAPKAGASRPSAAPREAQPRSAAPAGKQAK